MRLPIVGYCVFLVSNSGSPIFFNILFFLVFIEIKIYHF